MKGDTIRDGEVKIQVGESEKESRRAVLGERSFKCSSRSALSPDTLSLPDQ